MTKNSIRKKMLKGSMSLIVPLFIVIILAVAGLSTKQSKEVLAKSEAQIKGALLAKGQLLIVNNAQALSGMAGDNAFLSVQELVSQTVKADEDIVFGIYMDEEKKAWVFSNDSNKDGVLEEEYIFKDSVSSFVSKQTKVGKIEGGLTSEEMVEFYSPVVLDDEILGHVRYGLSTKRVVVAIKMAQEDSQKALMNMIFILLGLGVASTIVGFFMAKKQAAVFAYPIMELNKSADLIAGGNYQEAVQMLSDDEVGDLANSFEEMRVTIKKYTEHLQELVDEKMRQVRDILDNIDQGLFTVNIDGTINDEFSKVTNEVLCVDDVSKVSLSNALHMSDDVYKDWIDWVELVQLRHKKMRWSKLIKLAPINEIELPVAGEPKYVEISYQPVFDVEGNVSRIMVLVRDVTAKRKIEKIVADEKMRHENEVKTILGLVNNLPESIQDFFKDSEERFTKIEKGLKLLITNINLKKNNEDVNLDIEADILTAIFRDLHTVKGNAASYGFEKISFIANEAEDLLETLQAPIRISKESTINLMLEQVSSLREERTNIDRMAAKLRGGESMTLQISESKIEEITDLITNIHLKGGEVNTEALQNLLDICKTLKHVPLGKLANKYQGMVRRVAENLGKSIDLYIVPKEKELPPNFFKPFNESLIHILRNAADHGIETVTEREAIRKPNKGTIKLEVIESDDNYQLEINDDGKGVDADVLVQKAIRKGQILEANVGSMLDSEKLDLLFLPGLSTKEITTEISGRGVGMDSVKVGLEKVGGNIKVTSSVGKGTTFVVTIPKKELIS